VYLDRIVLLLRQPGPGAVMTKQILNEVILAGCGKMADLA
jgi:hypothetical protein